MIKTWFEKKFTSGAKLGTFLNLIVGYLAAIANNGLTLPLQVVSTRIMVSRTVGNSVLKEVKSILQESGVSGLYRGWRPSIVLCINPAISFAAFEQLKLRLLRRRGLDVSSSISSFDAFALGAIAKAIATVVTFPFIRVKTIMQVHSDRREGEGSKANSSNVSLVNMLARIWNTEGLRGLYVGVYPQLLKGIIASAVLFAAKERIFELVHKKHDGPIIETSPTLATVDKSVLF